MSELEDREAVKAAQAEARRQRPDHAPLRRPGDRGREVKCITGCQMCIDSCPVDCLAVNPETGEGAHGVRRVLVLPGLRDRLPEGRHHREDPVSVALSAAGERTRDPDGRTGSSGHWSNDLGDPDPRQARDGGDGARRASRASSGWSRCSWALADPDAAVRRLAVAALEELGDARAVPGVIIACLLRHRSRGAGGRQRPRFATFAAKSAATPLIEAMQHADPEVRRWVIVVAPRAQGSARGHAALASARRSSRSSAARSRDHARATCASPESVEPAPQATRRPGRERAPRRASARSTTSTAPRCSRTSCATLGDSDWRVRAEAAIVLGRSGLSGAIPGLLAALRDPTTGRCKKRPSRRSDGCRRLSAVPELLVVPRASEVVGSAPRRRLRARGDQERRGRSRSLRELANDPDIEVRKAARRALRSHHPGARAFREPGKLSMTSILTGRLLDTGSLYCR